MYSQVEVQLLEKIKLVEPGQEAFLLARKSVAEALSLDVDSVSDNKMMPYISNLYYKLIEGSFIPIRNRAGLIDILNDIVSFRLHSNELLIGYMLGQIKAASYAMDFKLQEKNSHN